MRRATLRVLDGSKSSIISIHALLAESDRPKFSGIAQHTYFYPRSPCGERPSTQQEKNNGHEFLSTLSLRRATEPPRVIREPATNFYPRSPCGERRQKYNFNKDCLDFYPRSPCGERRVTPELRPTFLNFYPRSPCGERRCFARFRYWG